MSGRTRSAEKMRLVAMSCGSGKEKGWSSWVLRHPPLHTLPADPEAHLLPHILLKFLLGSFHFPQVMKLSSHLSTGKPRLPASSLLSQGHSRVFISTPGTCRPLPQVTLPDLITYPS